LRLHCAAISEPLLECELFGHERGAFTGALQPKPGLLETAEGGTVLLDEIGELPALIQVKLLRILEERSIRRVGGLQPRAIDVRFIAATNRDLEDAMARGAFRRDLYHRLDGISLRVPPLRERGDEIADMARGFIAPRPDGRVPALSDEALAAIVRHGWPGNVRELRNVIERATILCDGELIRPEHLRLGEPAAPPAGDDERARIVAALERSGGNQSRAAKLLGISRGTLLSRLDLYGIARPIKRR
jgi:transcriptional regulator with PAS, ATPase and Fis domain